MAGHALHLENTHGEVRGGPRMRAGHSGTDPPWVIRGDAFRRAGSDRGDALCLVDGLLAALRLTSCICDVCLYLARLQ